MNCEEKCELICVQVISSIFYLYKIIGVPMEDKRVDEKWSVIQVVFCFF